MHIQIKSFFAVIAALIFMGATESFGAPNGLEKAMIRAGDNRSEIESALAKVPDDQRTGLEWLIIRMPVRDLTSLDAEYLLNNTHHAYAAWRDSPWHDQISEEVFFDSILPYASINERRDNWRSDFRQKFSPIVKNAKTPSEAAALLNQKVFPMVGVKYSTQRPKADQSPYESIDAGMASCTGLSVLLVDACRSVGVPARFVGTPLWSDGSGNHSWVEVWDDGWHFTGAAEPTGADLDKGWFTGRASGARRDDPRNAIYATTWRKTPLSFPMSWRPGDQSVSAVDVTDRYTIGRQEIPEGSIRVRFKVAHSDGSRVNTPIKIRRGSDDIFAGNTKDERFDANDHLEVILEQGGTYTAEIPNVVITFTADQDEMLVNILASDEQSTQTVDQFRTWLRTTPTDKARFKEFSKTPLSKTEAGRVADLLWKAHTKKIREERTLEMDAKSIEINGVEMPIWYTTFGDPPSEGRSLWISMHGGGGAPPRVNTQQWKNQQGLYKPEEGVYLAPRAPTDTWNLWHQGHIDGLLDRLIENMIVFEDVDPDKVYIMGYSAGGDGVSQLGPRLADRRSAAAMMAGHPKDTAPESLRNTSFTLHMGENDTPYKRNQVAKTWGSRLARLHEKDPEGYDHWVKIHEGKGHWMDGDDSEALPWMASKRRNLRPKKIVWQQDDVTHSRFYWLKVNSPTPRSKITGEIRGQDIYLQGEGPIAIRLDDSMIDLDKEIVVYRGDAEVFRGIAPRTIEALELTLRERGDPKGMFSAEIRID